MALLDNKTQTSLDAFVYKQLLQSAGLDKGLSGMAGMVFTDVLSEAIAKSSAPLMPIENAATPAGISSGFGVRKDPFTGEAEHHDGVDLPLPIGEPIHATWDGTVVSAGERGGYGNAIEVDHGNGVHTLYGHASRVDVKPGDHVQAGEKLGEVGTSGRSTGPHLHLELRVGGHPADPASALKAYRDRDDDHGEVRKP
jgi:murein DD-endopeptidase MepM/ murein hydrolase activator NlpD